VQLVVEHVEPQRGLDLLHLNGALHDHVRARLRVGGAAPHVAHDARLHHALVRIHALHLRGPSQARARQQMTHAMTSMQNHHPAKPAAVAHGQR
jgi:hypothetical protein